MVVGNCLLVVSDKRSSKKMAGRNGECYNVIL